MNDEEQNNMNTDNQDINEKNLLVKIWLEPTATLTYIFENCSSKYVTILIVLSGIVNAIDRASTKNMGENMSTLAVLAFAIIAGGLLGWISIHIYAWAMSATGKWLKGKASPSSFRTILAWSSIPAISSLILLIPEVILFGDELFKSEPVVEYDIEIYLWYIFAGIEIILSIWSIVILVKGIVIIQNFKIGKSILNMLLPALVFIIPIGIILILFQLNIF